MPWRCSGCLVWWGDLCNVLGLLVTATYKHENTNIRATLFYIVILGTWFFDQILYKILN